MIVGTVLRIAAIAKKRADIAIGSRRTVQTATLMIASRMVPRVNQRRPLYAVWMIMISSNSVTHTRRGESNAR